MPVNSEGRMKLVLGRGRSLRSQVLEVQRNNEPVKQCMNEAFSALVDSEGKGRLTGSMDDIEMDQQEMDTAMEATPSSADPIHLTGALDESHQEQ
jgi:hypothetical protein